MRRHTLGKQRGEVYVCVSTLCCAHFSALKDDQITFLLVMRDNDVVGYVFEAFWGACVTVSSPYAGVTDICLKPAESSAVAR